jgi:hypothetical protein
MGLGKDISDYYPHELIEEAIRQLKDCDDQKEEWPDITKSYNELTHQLIKLGIVNIDDLINEITTLHYSK